MTRPPGGRAAPRRPEATAVKNGTPPAARPDGGPPGRARWFERGSGHGHGDPMVPGVAVPARRAILMQLLVMIAGVLLWCPPVAAQARTEPAELTCPAVLGSGVETERMFCDVLTGLDPAAGIIVTLPPHTGTARLTFDLHNRQTYSVEQVKAGKAFARYTATIGVLTMKSELLARAVIQNEFRTAADLLDRVSGGVGPEGLKAVAPTGLEPISVTIPANVTQVSILGEKLEVERIGGRDLFTAPGRPIATISNVLVEYRPRRGRRDVATRGARAIAGTPTSF